MSIGRLTFPIESIDTELKQNGFDLLAIKSAHIIHTTSLEMFHRDPFDRILIAQAQVENLSLLTVDQHIQKYDLSWVW